MRFVYKPKGSRFYRGRSRLSDDLRRYDVPLRVEQRDLAEEKLRRLVREREQEALGLLPPKTLRDAALLPIAKHLAEYVANLQAEGASKKHASLSRNRVQRLCKECGWQFLRDITPDGFTRWRASQSLAPKTCNEYLGLTSAFLNWSVTAGRISSNPLASVGKAETRGRERRLRRALSIGELARLVESSPKRGLFYMLAAYTGLRRGEIKALLWTDLLLDAPKPFVLARASTTKNKKDAALPLVPELVAMLSAYRGQQRDHSGKVFPAGVPTAKALRSDLARVGIAATDAQGRRVDVHSLRKTFCTLLHVGGVSQRVAQDLMRHSEPRLTATVYTDSNLLPLHAELQKIARVSPSPTVTPKAGQRGLAVAQSIQVESESEVSEVPPLAQFVQACPGVVSGGGGAISSRTKVVLISDFPWKIARGLPRTSHDRRHTS